MAVAHKQEGLHCFTVTWQWHTNKRVNTIILLLGSGTQTRGSTLLYCYMAVANKQKGLHCSESQKTAPKDRAVLILLFVVLAAAMLKYTRTHK